MEAGERTGWDSFADFVVGGARSATGSGRQRKKREALAFTHLAEKRKAGQGEVLRQALARRDPDLAPPKPAPKPKSLLQAPLPKPKPVRPAPLPKPQAQLAEVAESLLKAAVPKKETTAKLGPHGWTLDPAPRRRERSDNLPPPGRVVEGEDHGPLKEDPRAVRGADSTGGIGQHSFILPEDDDPSTSPSRPRPQVPLQPGRDAAHDAAVIARKVGEVADEYRDRLADPDLSTREKAAVRLGRDQAIRGRLQSLREKGHLRGAVGLLAQATGIGLYDLSGASKPINPQAMQELVDLVSTEKGQQDLTRRIEAARAYRESYDKGQARAFGAARADLGSAVQLWREHLDNLTMIRNGDLTLPDGEGGGRYPLAWEEHTLARLRSVEAQIVAATNHLFEIGIAPPPHPELDPPTARLWDQDTRTGMEKTGDIISGIGAASAALPVPHPAFRVAGAALSFLGTTLGATGEADAIYGEEIRKALRPVYVLYAEDGSVDQDAVAQVLKANPDIVETATRQALEATTNRLLEAAFAQAAGGLAARQVRKVFPDANGVENLIGEAVGFGTGAVVEE